MRRILLADLSAAAQLVARWPAAERRGELDRLLMQTHAADRFSRRFGRPHPAWGDGSLLSRALADAPFPSIEDRDYWASLSLVVAAIAARRAVCPRKPLGLCVCRSIC